MTPPPPLAPFQRLERCSAWWGETELATEAPAVEVYSDALYIPFANGEAWGLFDAAGQPIEAAVDRHGPDLVTAAQVLSSELPAGAVVDDAPEPSYIYGGRMNAHYGHFLVNVLSRYWPWAGEGGPEERILFQAPAGTRWFDVEFIRDALGGAGLGPERFASFERPTRIPKLIVPHTAFIEQRRIHAAYRDLCVKIGRTLLGGPTARSATPAYLTKVGLRSGVGRFINEDQVVEVLQKNGVDIIMPETLTLREQIALLSERETVGGVSGSAFHTAVLAPDAARLVCLNASTYVNANFGLLDRARGADADYFWDPGTEVLAPEEDPHFLTSYRLPDPAGAAEDMLRLLEQAAKPLQAAPQKRPWYRALPWSGRSRLG